ncbi:MAG: hypothetical protein NTV93_00820 [Verrucomicrobia bacterium]|nr:hypothetical protein [Verrucomicrobiota bacterium]
MAHANRLKFFVVSALLVISANARALIVYDTAASTGNTKNVIDPANSATYPVSPALGVPWQYVVRYGANNASAVYIGNGYLLTARHVGTSDTGLLIQGTIYNRDTSFSPLPITVPGQPAINVDLQLQRISGDPGLSLLPLAQSATADTSASSVLVGWGVGKGTVISAQGWNWGDDASRAFRWGTNTTSLFTSAMTYAVGNTTMGYTALSVAFNSSKGPSEATATLGDSGSALFQSSSGTWALSGITTVVSTLNSSKYFPSDTAYFVRLREYSWVLRYDAWKAKYVVAQATADSDDSDGDGIPLLMEYALGLNPTIRSTEGVPLASIEGENLVLTYSRLASTTDIKVEVETSATLRAGDWVVEPAAITVLDGATVFQKVKASVSLGSGDRKFARLKVTRL